MHQRKTMPRVRNGGKYFVWILILLCGLLISFIAIQSHLNSQRLDQLLVTHIRSSPYHQVNLSEDAKDLKIGQLKQRLEDVVQENEKLSLDVELSGNMLDSTEAEKMLDIPKTEKTLDRDLLILAIHTYGLQYYGTPEQSEHVKPSEAEDLFMRKWFFDVQNGTTTRTEDLFKSCPGESSRCIFTADPNRYEEADVVIIRPGYMFDDPDHLNGHKLIRAHPDQKFAFQFLENPHQWEPGMMEQMNKRIGFNLTIHYQREADIWWPYGRKLPLQEPIQLTARNYAAGKTRKVLFVSSHCHTIYNHREHYMGELIKYIDVDVYGKCVDFSTEKDSTFLVQRIAKDYKFLIAFENADCDDYITEKFFKYLVRVDIIPIVLGRRSHYETLVPPMSYIQALQFDSPKQLAAYLHVLDKNDTMFNQYFEWKFKWTVQWFPKPFCDICRYMRQTHYEHSETDMVDFLELQNRCVKFDRDLIKGWETQVTNYTFEKPWITLQQLNSRGKPLRFP